MENVPTEGIKEPIYESGEGPITNPQRTAGKNTTQVYQSAESFGGKTKPSQKFGNR